MAYRLKRNDASMTAALRRVARQQVARAIEGIDRQATDAAEAVHDLRRRCKKVRGLLRLVRPAFAGYQRENAAFRDIARHLSPWRDATVLIAAYDAVTARFEAQIDRRALASIRRQLTLDRQSLQARCTLQDALARCRAELQQAQRRIDHWQLADDGFDALADGLGKTYARGRQAMRRACQQVSAGDMHEWRKRCKYHWCHARLLQPVWPGPMKAYACAARALSEELGDYHDLAVFLDVLTHAPEHYGDIRSVEVMIGLIRQNQAHLTASAIRQGQRLFADKPGALVDRWGRRYEAWGGGKVPGP
ncbi:CHAD domain-containing protein [Oleiagrimonas sp. C23AA]|uniref:CHAD domain-containing protein n=1 Tax=Oleiagrimonas sp. C23AA TaxID=2719047 RepID=UPI0014242E0E|nr:CHAD domain-containing protein [Oleiagrimonas sp. C23AA]NII11076.1 CHAD domain-containing protein [Oleiagrimonas sp. C23AA]